jgi:hypothetical protein
MERAYRAAVALRPGNLDFHRSLIAALDRQGEHQSDYDGREEALSQALRAAMQAGPNDAPLASQFGSLMMARGRWDGVVQNQPFLGNRGRAETASLGGLDERFSLDMATV